MSGIKPFVLSLFALFFVSKSEAGIIELGVDLGEADKYSIAVGQYDFFGTPVGGSLILGSEAYIHGSVAASPSVSLAAGAKGYGNVCSNSVSYGAGSEITGDASACDDVSDLANSVLDQLSLDIQYASMTASALAGETFDAINTSMTINAYEHDVVNVSGIALGSSDVLTINGNANDNLIINIAGNALIASGAKILFADGLTSNNVLFNFTSEDLTSLNFGGAEINGTFLANKASFIAGDGAILNDVRFFTNHALIGNFQTVRTADYVVTDVPEPKGVALLALGLGFFGLLRKRRRTL